jgi:hypothetical protein
MSMLVVLTPKVLLFVSVTLGILEMDLIVLVSNSFIYVSTSLNCYGSHLFFVISIIFPDIDECLTNPCHFNAGCTDNDGSFYCQCDGGFLGDGFSCTGKHVRFMFTGKIFIWCQQLICYIQQQRCCFFRCR